MSLSIPRRTYADLYGPTTGDRVRLGDTSLVIEIERDFAVYQMRSHSVAARVIRDGMGQSSRATRADGALDLVITNAVIIDHSEIIGRYRDPGREDCQSRQSGQSGHHRCRSRFDL